MTRRTRPAPRPRVRSRTRSVLSGAVLVLLVAACRALPVPIDVDLVPRLGDLASGSHTVDVQPGTIPDRSPIRYPTDAGDCIDVGDLPVRLERATIDYDVRIDYDGPPLEGTVTGQLHVAPEGADPWDGTFALGEPVIADLAGGSARLRGSVTANAAQVAAMNAGTICWGIELAGAELASPDGGTATIAYEVEELRLRGGVSVF